MIRLLLVCSAALLVAAPARAQEAAAPAPDAAHLDAETARRARAEYEAGVEHYRSGRYRDAIHSFQVAAALTPSADLSYNIARALEELARREGSPADWDAAIASYRRYLSDSVDPPDRAEVEAHVEELAELAEAARRAALARPSTGTLSLRVDRDGSSVRIDGEARGTSPLGEPFELSPGRHRVSVASDGYTPFEAEVSVEAGVRTSAIVELVPATGYRSQVGSPVLAWISFGLAGASLVGSAVLGAVAASDQSAALSPFDPARLSEARGLAGWSDAALGAAIGFGALGVVLFFAESASVGTTVTHGPGDGAVVEAPETAAPGGAPEDADAGDVVSGG
jgi:tetratricopeptide (TPR) repeat protein